MKRKTNIPVESEVKFYLYDKTSFEDRLRRVGALLLHKRVHEVNYRFDTAQMTFSRDHRVLRLRQDDAALITYKGPSSLQGGVTVRDEIEFEVSDFTAARQFLEALGFKESVRYEKWRTTYLLDDLEITLDEMPFGNFTEIEGNDPGQIQRTAIKLALDWSARINFSYMMLFDQVRRNKDIELTNLTFEDFRDIAVSADEMGVKAADKP
jgi:adenylate cyclase, class 2